MSHQGRSSANLAIFLAAILLFLQFDTSQGTSFTVGDSSGWNFNIQSWTNGKRFKAGDTLVFNYDKSRHNLVTVDAAGYSSCKPGAGSRTYTTGSDRIRLNRGKNYFLCSFPGHCAGGMKLVVAAS